MKRGAKRLPQFSLQSAKKPANSPTPLFLIPVLHCICIKKGLLKLTDFLNRKLHCKKNPFFKVALTFFAFSLISKKGVINIEL